MLDKSIDGALLALRKNIISSNGEGLEHVEALLRLRGVDLPRIPKQQTKSIFARRELTQLLANALKDGPKGGVALAAHVAEQRPEISYTEAQARIHQSLARMVANGFAVRDGRLWRLAQ
ncbi:MAG: hypothetical protein ACRCSU_09635 [Paracoccaceae bacterium]